MSKRRHQDDLEEPRKRAAISFKLSWLKELVETETVDSKTHKCVELGNIFTFSEVNGVVCKMCEEAKSSCEFAVGKIWDLWKMDYLKRHLAQKVHLESVSKLRRMKSGSGINNLLIETTSGRTDKNGIQRTSQKHR